MYLDLLHFFPHFERYTTFRWCCWLRHFVRTNGGYQIYLDRKDKVPYGRCFLFNPQSIQKHVEVNGMNVVHVAERPGHTTVCH